MTFWFHLFWLMRISAISRSFLEASSDIRDITLYRYTVGEEPLRIAEDVMSLMRDDLPSYISSSAPVICQYVSHKDIDFIVNFGTIENDKFVVKAQNAER